MPGIDVLRGFALWGICIVNLPLIARSWESYRQIPETGSARAALFINSLFFEAKFFTLFSFLYGIGLHILHKREDAGFLLRRFLGLILLGFLHAVFFFPGDILLSYGLLGLFFLPMRRMHNRALAVSAAFLLLMSGATYAFLGFMGQANPQFPVTHYTGGFGAVVMSNLHLYPISLGYVMLFNWPGALAMICLGYLAARSNWISRIRLTPVSTLIVLTGVGGSMLYATVAVWQLKQYLPMAMLLMALTAPALSLFYAQSIFSLNASQRLKRALHPLAAAGRMSLTNYVLQSVLAGTLFYGYGFGLYNRLSYDGLFLVATGIFLSGITLSLIWLKYFQTGPLEWLLRSLSHLEVMQLRRSIG